MLGVAFFDIRPFSKGIFTARNRHNYRLTFFDHRLTPHTAASAKGHEVVCVFVNDTLDAGVIGGLHEIGVGLIALRCAGYNNVDLAACDKYGVNVVHVPAYSPSSVAEHGVALMLALNRHIPRAHARVRDGNFSLDGLVGFEMHGKTVGLIGTGRIGKCAARILAGFGCRILAYDTRQDEELVNSVGVSYTDLDTVFRESDIISLHVPLLPTTHHLISADAISKMKRGVMLINTSRGGLVNTRALIRGLKSGQVGSAGLDVYEEEDAYFFEDFSDTIITDDVLARLLTFNNVLITSHQAFLTKEALEGIAETTMNNIREYEQGKRGKALTNGICGKCS